jgi:cell division protein FtsI (penicillin-binding protein 3)
MRKGFASSARLFLLAALTLAAFGAIALRLVHLHWWKRDELLAHVDRARKQIVVENARRGDIVDLRGNRLATSRSAIELGADPQVLRPEDEARWPELARLIGRPLAEIDPLLRRRYAGEVGARIEFATLREAPAAEDSEDGQPDAPVPPRAIRWVKLAEGLDESTYERVLALGIRGVYGHRHYRRTYPHGQRAAHVIGFVNREQVAASGAERFFDFYLRGQSGWRESERDGRRRELAQFRTREVPPTDGFDVGLTLDLVVQHVIEEELEHIARTFRPDSATIIVSEAATGAILGLANWPTFDLNQFNRADLAVQRNFALTDLFEPGSTFKIVAAAAALEEGLVTPRTVFDCGVDTVIYEGRPRALPRDAHPYGELSVADIVGKSSNRGAAHLGVRLGAQRLHDWSRAFGFGEATGFPFGGEINGVLHPVRAWDGLTITRLPMGHAVGATAMQVHFAMSVIANDGVLLRPVIVREIRDRDGRVLAGFEPHVRRRVLSPETAQLMARLLVQAASAEGTGKAAEIPGYEVAGKTGTTQKIIDGRYSSRHHVGSFVGFFPASRPELVITVVVNNGKPPGGGLGYGGVVAAPSFKRVAEQLIPYLGIPPASAPAAPRSPLLALGSSPRDRLPHP